MTIPPTLWHRCCLNCNSSIVTTTDLLAQVLTNELPGQTGDKS